MRKSVVFPRAGGGSWLSNLIHKLETNNTDLVKTEVGQVFDGTIRSRTIKFKHYFDRVPETVNDIVIYVDPGEEYFLFSTDCPFNLYLNDAVKVKLNSTFNTNIVNATLNEKFFEFSYSAVYLLTNPLYQQKYYQNIDLNLRDIFVNPENFVDQLFNFLDEQNVEYTPNKEFVLASCEKYVATCPNPKEYVNNWDNLLWLSWVHALTTLDNIDIDIDFFKLSTIEELQQALLPFKEFGLEKTKGLYFTWP